MVDYISVRRSARHVNGSTALGSMRGGASPTIIIGSNTSSNTATPARGIYFRFLDLPSELRNNIYALALSDNTNTIRNLSDLKFPLLVQVSRQIRQESLAFLFAENSFKIPVGSNIVTRAKDRNGVPRDLSFDTDSLSKAGTLGYKRIVQRFLKSAGDAAIFKDITFNVYYSDEDITAARHADKPKSTLDDRRVRDNDCLGSLRLSTTPVFTASFAPLGFQPKSAYVGIVDIAAAVQNAAQVARDIVGEGNSKGFRVSDINKIARRFRYEL